MLVSYLTSKGHICLKCSSTYKKVENWEPVFESELSGKEKCIQCGCKIIDTIIKEEIVKKIDSTSSYVKKPKGRQKGSKNKLRLNTSSTSDSFKTLKKKEVIKDTSITSSKPISSMKVKRGRGRPKGSKNKIKIVL